MEISLLNLEQFVTRYLMERLIFTGQKQSGLYINQVLLALLKEYPNISLSSQKFSYLFRISVNSLNSPEVQFIRKTNGVFVTGIEFQEALV